MKRREFLKKTLSILGAVSLFAFVRVGDKDPDKKENNILSIDEYAKMMGITLYHPYQSVGYSNKLNFSKKQEISSELEKRSGKGWLL